MAHSHNLDDQEILLRGKHGNYEWFVLRIRHGEGSSKNPNSVTVLLDAADPERVLQLENMRIRDFYRASLSEAIAYAELDLESNQFRAAGGLWAGYEKEPLEEHESLLDFMKRKSKDQVRFLDQPPLDGFPNNDQNDPQKLLSTQPDTHRLRYQRLLDGQWIWVELVAHTFRERFTENAYALLYLKNIDVQTRRELAHRDAAQRDPLTNVYNRTTFRKEVEKYLSAPDSGRTGVMILLDVDNFKRINDHYGHLEGDRALKRVTILLQNAFRSDDLIGRLGGDEFMVFIKGGIRRSSLEERLQSFLHALQGDKAEPITCSAGITFVKGGAFSFEESVCQADMALYKSKQTGKNHFCYAEDTLEKPKE